LSAVACDPYIAEAWANLSNVHRRLGEIEEAIETAGRSVQLAPARPEAHSALGSALMAAGRLDQAVEAFSASYASDPSRIESVYNLAVCWDKKGNRSKAVQAFRRFLKAWRGDENPFVDHARRRLSDLSDRP
jgi:tetratricopeptide (TPR) repeat protein